MIKRGIKYCKLSELKVNIGKYELLLNQKITKIKKVGMYNLLIYKKQRYRHKSVSEKWYILTNLSSPGKVKKVYSQRMGIEAMFKDYKSGRGMARRPRHIQSTKRLVVIIWNQQKLTKKD